MKAKYLSVLLALFLLLPGCSQDRNDSVAAETAMAIPLEKMGGPDQAVQPIERKLIKDGNVEFETDDLAATRRNIYKAVEKYNGYIDSDQEFKSSDRISHTITARVPAEQFDPMMSEATEGITQFDRKIINIRDVTEEFVDVEARLRTKKELESRLHELLKQAKTVSEILEIETQLGTLRADIESVEGRMKYLNSQVSFSTLSLTFYQMIPKTTAFGRQFSEGIRNGWQNLVWFFVGLVNIWPFLLIAAGAALWWRIYRKRWKS